jgi:hypothetical protein
MALRQLILIWVGHLLMLQTASAQLLKRTVEVPQFEYKVTIPAGWDFDLSNSGVPVIFNFKREEGGPQGLFPEHGATIYIHPELGLLIPGIPGKQRDRILQGAQEGRVILKVTHIPDFRAGSRAPHQITREDADLTLDGPDGLIEREITYSFRLRQSRFQLVLTYYRGDRLAADFEARSLEILRSVVGI